MKTIGGLLSSRSSEEPFLIGLLTPLLPCGLLYSMLFKAAETRSVLHRALTMLAFGAGIVPALFITGLASGYVGLRLHSQQQVRPPVDFHWSQASFLSDPIPLSFPGTLNASAFR